MSEEAVKPKFCPNGCGETIEATPLTDGPVFELISNSNSIFKNHWKIKCTKCDHNSFLSEGIKEEMICNCENPHCNFGEFECLNCHKIIDRRDLA